MIEQEALVERLTAENDEFRRLREAHQGYEHELEALKQRPYLSADQQQRIGEIKKLKLATKDRMEVIIGRARQTASSQATV